MPKYTLMKHQAAAVDFLDEVDGVGALLMDPGVGKTGATLAWIDRMADRLGEFRVLVVAPLAATDTWVLQAPMFMDSPVKSRMLQGSTANILARLRTAGAWTDVPDMAIKIDHPGTTAKQVSGNRVTILSMSAGAVSSYCTDRTKTVHMLQAMRKYRPHLIVVDESHIIKSHNANLSKAMYQIGQMAPHRIILTGTVTPHSDLDIYGQWRFMAPWTYSQSYGEPFTLQPSKMTRQQVASVRPWSWTTFCDRYAQKGGYRGKKIVGVNPAAEKELRDRMAERSFVVRKSDALPDLPPVRDVDVHVTLSPAETRAYDEMRDQLAAQMADGSLLEAKNPLSKIMKLRQVTAGFMRDTDTEQTHVIGTSKQKTICDLINTTLLGEQRVVVFAYFRSECENLVEALRTRGRTVEMITGDTKPKDRLAIRQRFFDVSGNPEQTILVAQVTTMSLSVNELVTAQNAIYASLTNQRAHWQQSRDRLDRNGQIGSHVTFWNVTVPGTIDEVMLQNHLDRGSMEKALLDHIRNTPRKG